MPAVSKGKTAAVRKILLAQKTFANYIADEEAALAIQDQQASSINQPRSSVPKLDRTPSAQLKRSTSAAILQPSSNPTTPTAGALGTPATINPQISLMGPDVVDAHLLQSNVPPPPSAGLMEALLSGPQLSYNAARAAPPTAGKPQRHFCEICGYWGRVKCMRCGARACGLECKTTHDEERCQKFFG
ncbi:hypothetical protein MMC24_002075 [Lignoscripta atroalba]|nr:hypothetical protein [Lignoscripta atroalba]